jgi:hypothetical protein
MLTKDLPWSESLPPSERGRRARLVAATALHGASLALARLARHLLPATRRQGAAAPPLLEFHAEAGAPEGALYVDGQFVGHLHGVTRL